MSTPIPAAASPPRIGDVPVRDEQRPGEPLLDESGHFHATDAPIELRHYSVEAWLAFGFFWLLALDVFYQFFTRYALNNSASWTEEIARYLLISMVFVGVSAAVRTSRHMMEKMTNYKMTIIDLPMNLVYGVCMLGFALAALRSVQVAVLNWRRGYSALERPDLADEIAR